MCRRPVLAQTRNYNKPFVVLPLMRQPMGGHHTLTGGRTTPKRQNLETLLHPHSLLLSNISFKWKKYDIYERELLAVVKAFKTLETPPLEGPAFPFTVVTGPCQHCVLERTKRHLIDEPRDGMASYRYWFDIQPTPGNEMRRLTSLSRHPKADRGESDNRRITIFPPAKFVDSHFVIPLEIRGEAPTVHQVPPPLPQASHLQVFDIDSIYGTLDEEVAALHTNTDLS